ncbi:MAG TPA: hypothetical protein PK777_18255, partial [Thermoguttaceae bacterium]|nr:hypothetical protein [Thermoguttaceae bacterium]
MGEKHWLRQVAVIWAAAAGWAVAIEQGGLARAEEVRPAEWVEVVRPAELKVENQVVGRLIPGTLVQRQQTQGTWLWVQQEGRSGWVQADQVQKAQVRRPGILEFPSGLFLEYDEDEEAAIYTVPEGPNRCFAYVTKGARGQRVVVNGRPGRLYDEIVEVALSRDGQRWAYVAKKGEKELVVLDGQEGPEYNRVGLMGIFDLIFSADG